MIIRDYSNTGLIRETPYQIIEKHCSVEVTMGNYFNGLIVPTREGTLAKKEERFIL